MSKGAIITTIIGSALTAGLATSVNFFPQYSLILVAASGLVTAIVGTVNGRGIA